MHTYDIFRPKVQFSVTHSSTQGLTVNTSSTFITNNCYFLLSDPPKDHNRSSKTCSSTQMHQPHKQWYFTSEKNFY